MTSQAQMRVRGAIGIPGAIEAKCKIGEVRAEMSALRDGVAALGVKLESSLRKMTVWWFLSLASVLGVLAKGFHW